eukprot:5305699-Prorocentrum_lima.AAC.1
MSGANNKPAMAEMPGTIKAMFQPRPPLENPHPDPYARRKRKGKHGHASSFTGVSSLKQLFEATSAPKRQKTETP